MLPATRPARLLRRRVGLRDAAVDHEARGVDVARLVAGEEQHGAGDLAHLGEAARRDVHQPARGGDRVLGEQRSEEHTSELQSLTNLVCRLLLEKKKIQLWAKSPPQTPTTTFTPSF